jgi:hypothetical protein
VYYLEDSGESSSVYNWETAEQTDDLEYPGAFIRECLDPLGFSGKWIYRAGSASVGMDPDDFLQICAAAELVIVRAIPLAEWREEYGWPRRRIFIDVDPGFTQMRLANGNRWLAQSLERCEVVFTIAQRLEAADCTIPAAGRRWLTTVAPIALSNWPVADQDRADYFTSMIRWRGLKDVTYNGVVYGQRDMEFPKFFDLPRLTAQPFRLALQGGNHDRLTELGWDVISGWPASSTPHSYQAFIQQSRAEFGVAKHGYVATRSGWFSDRSVCYLASGRPALVQDTGLGDWLPTGEGLVTFRDLSEAVQGVERINTDYERHRRAARQLAEEYFAADRILRPLLEAALG